MCLEIIQSIVYAKNDLNYDEIRQKLEDINLKTVIDYFNKTGTVSEQNGLYTSNQNL